MAVAFEYQNVESEEVGRRTAADADSLADEILQTA
jgi:hypothetical protein